METIEIKNICLYAFHGCLEEEGKIGSFYRVDIEVKGDLEKSMQSDQLSDTVDYVRLHALVKREMAIRSKLLESVAKRIVSGIFEELPMVKKAKVRLAKKNPPMGGNVEEVAVVLSQKRKS